MRAGRPFDLSLIPGVNMCNGSVKPTVEPPKVTGAVMTDPRAQALYLTLQKL